MSAKLARAMETGRLTLIKTVSGEVTILFPTVPNYVLSKVGAEIITDRGDITAQEINKSNIKSLLLGRLVAIVD